MNSSFCNIDDDAKNRILRLFSKTQQDLDDYVKLIMEWLKTQPHLPETPSTTMIEYFVVNSKFSVETTKKKIDMYYTVRTLIDAELGNINPKSDCLKAAFKIITIVPLPKLKDGLYRIMLLQAPDIPPEEFCVRLTMATVLNLYEIRMHEDFMFGDILIFNCQYVTLRHMLRVTPSQVKLTAMVLEKLYSNRIKEIHIFNHHPAIDRLLKLVKLFVKEKLINRIHLHDSIDSLLNYVPLELLPKDFGGGQQSIENIKDLFKEKLIEYGPRFDKLEKLRVNESLRPTRLITEEDFGVQGSFRQLNLD